MLPSRSQVTIHNFGKTFVKAVFRSRLCPHRTHFVLATSHLALEPRCSLRRPNPIPFDNECSGKSPFPEVRHCIHSARRRKGSHQRILAWLLSNDFSSVYKIAQCDTRT